MKKNPNVTKLKINKIWPKHKTLKVDKTPELKIWQNQKNKNVAKLKALNFDNMYMLRLWQNSESKSVKRLKLLQNSKTWIGTKFNSKFD